LIHEADRKLVIQFIDEAVAAGARTFKCCDIVGISIRTLQRWRAGTTIDRRKGAPKWVANKLSPEIIDDVIQTACAPEYRNDTPMVLYVRLLEEHCYLASPRSIYRILKAHGLLKRRCNGAVPTPRRPPPERVATGPDQVWTWDITYMPMRVQGLFYYAYVFLDIWSRKIVGWQIHEKESPELASQCFERSVAKEGNRPQFLHSDNGNPMKGLSMLATLYRFGVIPSYSRPRVSNDNAYSESLFKTAKYVPHYPGYFESLSDARAWFADFVHWYNTKHRHSGIGYVTPEQRHTGADRQLFDERNRTLQYTRLFRPEIRRQLRDWVHIEKVVLNANVS
jgi:transposase InsO family protein